MIKHTWWAMNLLVAEEEEEATDFNIVEFTESQNVYPEVS